MHNGSWNWCNWCRQHKEIYRRGEGYDYTSECEIVLLPWQQCKDCYEENERNKVKCATIEKVTDVLMEA